MPIIKLGVADSNAPDKKHAFDSVDNIKTGETKEEKDKPNKIKK